MTFTTTLTTFQLEARDTAVSPLGFRVPDAGFEDCYAVGDNLTVTSRTGDIFIGHIEDIDEPTVFPQRFWVELD